MRPATGSTSAIAGNGALYHRTRACRRTAALCPAYAASAARPAASGRRGVRGPRRTVSPFPGSLFIEVRRSSFRPLDGELGERAQPKSAGVDEGPGPRSEQHGQLVRPAVPPGEPAQIRVTGLARMNVDLHRAAALPQTAERGLEPQGVEGARLVQAGVAVGGGQTGGY